MRKGIFIVLSAVPVGVIAVLFFCPPGFLRIREVAVFRFGGEPRHVTELELIRLSGVKKGDNLLKLRLSRVRDNILHSRWIREVQLSKRIPGRLLIWVYEQEPAAFLDLGPGENGGLYLVNREEIFKKAEGDETKNLPVITGLALEEVPSHLKPILSLVGAFEKTPLLRRVGVLEIHRNREGDLSLLTKEGNVRVELGKKNWEENLERLSKSWETIQATSKSPKVVDLSYRRKIVVKQQF